jgi:ABC-type nitrate/sulfonate/bicarbonate transport system substrate-binding protein
MITTAYVPTIQNKADLILRFTAGLAAASQYTRQNRAEAVQIFAKRIPGQNIAALETGIQHIFYDPRMSAATQKAFADAQTEVLAQSSMKGKAPIALNDLLYRDAIIKVQSMHPEYFSDLPRVQ